MLDLREKIVILQLLQLEPTFHEGLEIEPIPGESGFFAREDGTIWTTLIIVRGQKWRVGDGAFRLVKPYSSPSIRYPAVIVYTGQRNVHTMMLDAFVGPCPPGLEGCHRDDVPINNAYSNLCWDTHTSNMQDKERLGNGNRGALSVTEKVEIRERRAAGEALHSLASEFGVTMSAISTLTRKGRQA